MFPDMQIPEGNPLLSIPHPGQRAWEGSLHRPTSSFNRKGEGLVFEIMISPASPSAPLPAFLLNHTESDSHKLDAKDADTRANHLPYNYTPCLSPSCMKDGALQQVRGLRKWESFVSQPISLSGFLLLLLSPHSPQEMFYKDNHDLLDTRRWVKCSTYMIILAPLQNGPWRR